MLDLRRSAHLLFIQKKQETGTALVLARLAEELSVSTARMHFQAAMSEPIFLNGMIESVSGRSNEVQFTLKPSGR